MPSFPSTDDLLDSLGGPAKAETPEPSLSLDNELDLGLPPAPVADLGDPLDALSGADAPASGVDPFGPELSLDSLGDAPGPTPASGGPDEVDLDLGPPSAAGPGDPFGSGPDSPFDPGPATKPPAPLPAALEDPFGSSLEPASPFDAPLDSPLDSMMELGAPGGSTSFTSDPVSVEASVDIPASTLTANPVHVNVPVEITISSAGREILIPIRLQLKIRIR